MSDWNGLIRLRRQFGLFSFFYASLHLAVYVAFDAGPTLRAIRDDALERPFILLGLAAFALLIPLAATSNQAASHFLLQAKVGDERLWPYAVLLACLLVPLTGGHRRAWRYRKSPSILLCQRGKLGAALRSAARR